MHAGADLTQRDPPQGGVHGHLDGSTAATLEACDVYVDTKPYIVTVAGLVALGLDTTCLDAAGIFT